MDGMLADSSIGCAALPAPASRCRAMRDNLRLPEHTPRAVRRPPRSSGPQLRGRPQRDAGPARRPGACKSHLPDSPPTLPGYSPYCPYTIAPDASGEWKARDLARARELVAASGTKGAKVVVWAYPNWAEESRYFVSLLRRHGYRAQLREFPDAATYFTRLSRTPSVQAGIAAWLGMQLAADVFGTLRCRFALNWAHFCDRRLDAEVRRPSAVQAHDPTAGAALAARIDREIVDRAPWVPLFSAARRPFAAEIPFRAPK